MSKLLLLLCLTFAVHAHADTSVILAQIETGLGQPLGADQAAIVTDQINQIEAGETRPGEWMVLLCGGGYGGLMPAFPAGAMGASCVQILGETSIWLGSINVGLIGGAAGQAGVMLIRVYEKDITGVYGALEGGSSLYVAGLQLEFAKKIEGLDKLFTSTNTMMRLSWAPGVGVNGSLGLMYINRF